MFSLPLSSLGLEIQNHSACHLLSVQDRQVFVHSAVTRLAQEVDTFYSKEIPSELAPKIAEFVVWHVVLDGLQKFEERFVNNAQTYDWLSPTSTPGVDIYGVTKAGSQWLFVVVEVKWSEKCDYDQITSTSKGLVHDLMKMFEGAPSNRLSTRLSSLKRQLRRYAECSEACDGLRQVIVGFDAATTQGVQFVGFFVGDVLLSTKKNGFDTAFTKFRTKAKQAGWRDESLETYTITGSPLFKILDDIARGNV